MSLTASYNQPIKATLHVHLETGETWEVDDDDLERFGLVRAGKAYMRFQRALVGVLDDAGLLPRDVCDTALNPVRYLAEMAIVSPSQLDLTEHAAVAELERRLRRSIVRTEYGPPDPEPPKEN